MSSSGKFKMARLFLFTLTTVVLGSCGRTECNNTNTVFENFNPETKEYKNELAKQIQCIGSEKLSYWFEHYLQKNGQDYIEIYIQGEGLCAKGGILVNEWGKIKNLKGNGYRGAKLKGLKLDIQQHAVAVNLIYKDIEKIID